MLRSIAAEQSAHLSWEPGELEESDRDHQAEAGAALFQEVYAEKADELKARIHDAHPLMARWMIREGYGRVLSRPGLDKSVRELLALASLAVLGVSPQVKAHIGGAFRLGATKRQIVETIYMCAGISPVPDRELYLDWAKKL